MILISNRENEVEVKYIILYNKISIKTLIEEMIKVLITSLKLKCLYFLFFIENKKIIKSNQNQNKKTYLTKNANIGKKKNTKEAFTNQEIFQHINENHIIQT